MTVADAGPGGGASSGGGMTTSSSGGAGGMGGGTGAHGGASVGGSGSGGCATCPSEVLATGQIGAAQIAVGTNLVYWTALEGGDAVLRATPKSGNGVFQLAMVALATPKAVAAIGTTVCWAWVGGAATGGVACNPNDGNGVFTPAAATIKEPWDLHFASQDTLFVSDAMVPSKVWKLDPNAIEPLAFFNDASYGAHILGLTFHNDTVYWINIARPRRVEKYDGAGAPIEISQAAALDAPKYIVVDDDYAFWTDVDPDGGLWRGDQDTATKLWAGAALDLVVDAAHVYWTNPPDGKVFRAARNQQPMAKPDPIASNLMKPQGIAQDDQAIYWTDELAGNVWRRGKLAP
ncbi:MAG: hypothetical protein WKG00_14690 [Polyangiaceae bacterium]